MARKILFQISAMFILYITIFSGMDIRTVTAGNKEDIVTREFSKGELKGKLIWSASRQPLKQGAVILALKTSENKCILKGNLSAIVTERGNFKLHNIPEGTYVVFYSQLARATKIWEFHDGLSISLRLEGLTPMHEEAKKELFSVFKGGSGSIKVQKGSKFEFTDGKLSGGDGSIIFDIFYLTMDYRDAKPITVTISAGKTLEKDIYLWEVEEKKVKEPEEAFFTEEEKYFKEAMSKRSIQAYREFLELFPESTFKEKVHAKLEELYNKRHPKLRNVRTAKIIINSTFPKGYEFEQESIPRKLIEYTGLKIVEANETSDIALTIDIEGVALSASYRNLGIQYSGAQISGSIAITHDETLFQKKVFYKRINPTFAIFSRKDSASSAPFYKPIESEFLPKLLRILVDAFGSIILEGYIQEYERDTRHFYDIGSAMKVLAAKWKERDPWAISYTNKNIADVSAHTTMFKRDMVASFIDSIRDFRDERTVNLLINFIDHEYWRIQDTAISSLGDIGDVRAVKPLIELLLKIPEGETRKIKTVTEALGKITGKTFGEDRRKWEIWSKKGMPTKAQQVDKPKTIATGNKVIITGQLVKKDGSPVTYGRVEINEWVEEGNKFRIKIGEGGIYLNPSCKVDDEGRFTLELDLDVFEGVEAFAILAELSENSFARWSPLRNRNGNLIVFEFSEGAKNLDLGQIVVE